MSRYINFFLAFAFLAILITGCEDPIDVQLDEASTLVVVDAWLNNRQELQTIRLTETLPYFANAFTPVITGASVKVSTSEGKVIKFEDQGDGEYVWMPQEVNEIGAIGTQYELEISANGKEYRAFSILNPTVPVDSIVQEERVDDILGPDGTYLQFYGRDRQGIGNTYWIKSYKNDMWLNKPEEINIAFDGGFDAGAEVDGLIFISPIREFINPVADTSMSELPPWIPGDMARVEIHSITPEAFGFLEIARDQILNGLNGIFAEPLSNTRGNIINMSGEEEVLGVFCVSAVSELSYLVQ